MASLAVIDYVVLLQAAQLGKKFFLDFFSIRNEGAARSKQTEKRLSFYIYTWKV